MMKYSKYDTVICQGIKGIIDSELSFKMNHYGVISTMHIDADNFHRAYNVKDINSYRMVLIEKNARIDVNGDMKSVLDVCGIRFVFRGENEL
jgi:hypothetical protein